MLDTITSWFATLLAALLPGFGDDPTPVYNGYVEADYVYAAPSVTGRIHALSVREGQEIVAGAFLFDIEANQQRAALRAANARVAQAEANLRNLETGSREQEIAVIRASLAEARAQQTLARSTLARTESLFARDLATEAKVDIDRAGVARAEAHVAQLEAQLAVADLPARDAQVLAAEATLAAARAEADLAAARLDDMHVTSPVQGRIEKVFFEAGEVAAAGAPVISILPPDALTVLFYLPQGERTSFAIGEALALSCDGCPHGITATITRMAAEPQFTPPIIYSRDERARLVFRAEARLPRGTGLLPGQPVTLARLP
ncbi:HlyD family secretion protein [Sinisalibacter lacisalsi]|uniref:Hemolysin secretion protein D n=1 Tax=Sinisalibacter lacisalsi TaxID=1526570 RepID=A0ABQ1QWL7_9RHOB|nr:HlyD family efflux transporter periplasmic adaptor subunit [Sinisalibacter lacisalsi]GGD46505.1 hemolysin secretion protein D [Sinisalibacter lacisalsi]